MIKFSMVDVESVTSSVPRSNFDEAALDTLADMILESGGILKPLVLKKTGFEQYSVFDGHFEYYAAVRAREKNPREGEMVNAWIVSSESESAVVKQAETLTMLSSPAAAKVEIKPVLVSSDNETKLSKELIQQVEKLLEQQKTSIDEQLKTTHEKLDKIISSLIPPLPPPPPSKLNLLTATKKQIIEAIKNQKQADAAWNAIQHWLQPDRELTWNNLEKSTKSGKDKIKDFAKGTYQKLQEVADIPQQ
jgi:hypothetical protein